LVRTFTDQFCLRRWHGWRLLATDGSTVRLPNTADVAALFGPPPKGSAVPLGRFSQLCDVLNDVVVDADVFAHLISKELQPLPGRVPVPARMPLSGVQKRQISRLCGLWVPASRPEKWVG
jgi:hypothetical protein